MYLKLVTHSSTVLGDVKWRNDQSCGPLRLPAEPAVRRRVGVNVPAIARASSRAHSQSDPLDRRQRSVSE